MVAGRRGNFYLLCEKGKTRFTFAVRPLDVPLAPPAKRKFTPIRGSASPVQKKLRPSLRVRTPRKPFPPGMYGYSVNAQDKPYPSLFRSRTSIV